MGEVYTIKKVCNRLDVDRRTLKQWEASLKGYLHIDRDDIDGARIYTEEQIDLLSDIKQLFNEKCTLDEVKEYIQLLNDEQEAYEAVAASCEITQEEIALSSEEHIDEQPLLQQQSADQSRLATEDEKQLVQQAESDEHNSLALNTKEMLQGELVEAVRRYEDVFEVLSSFKEDLLKEMREGMRNEVREEIVGEVKKELEKSTTQTMEMVETVGTFISESSERSAKEVENMSKKIIRSNDKAFEEISAIIDEQSQITDEKSKEMRLFMQDIVSNADESSKEMQYLLDRFSSNSTVAMNQVKFMVEKLSNSSNNTTEELRDLIDSMNEERVYYLKEMEKDRKIHRNNIAEREEMFNDFVQTFRQTAAADMKRKRKWWKLFLS
ncbi:MerR family transcriptional regulator [Priestia megaterium]|nr:MerR family transcriptional regulator [Priestia megaterium]